MNPAKALDRLAEQGLLLWVDGVRLRWRARVGTMTRNLLVWLRAHKPALVEALANPADPLPALYLEVFSHLPAGCALVTLEPDQVRRGLACGAVPPETAAGSVLLAYRATGGERCLLAIPWERYDGVAVLAAFEDTTAPGHSLLMT